MTKIAVCVSAEDIEPWSRRRISFSSLGAQGILAASSLLVFACEAWAAQLAALGGVASNAAKSVPGLVLLFAINVYCRWRGLKRFLEFTTLMVWSLVGLCLLGPLVLLAGRTRSALVDPTLLRIDTSLHFSTALIVRAIAQLPALQFILAVSYNLWIPLALAAVLVPIIRGHGNDARRYVLSLTIAALLTVGLFAIWPAVGPWRTEGFAANEQQAAVESYLSLLKSAGAVEINPEAGGIVAFPSFHVVLALLSAIALCRVRVLRWIALGMAGMICLSTITTGWHYLTDLLGGVAVSVVAFALARWLMKSLETRLSSSSRVEEKNMDGIAA